VQRNLILTEINALTLEVPMVSCLHVVRITTSFDKTWKYELPKGHDTTWHL